MTSLPASLLKKERGDGMMARKRKQGKVERLLRYARNDEKNGCTGKNRTGY